MSRISRAGAAIGAALALTAAQPATPLAQARGGLWEVSGVPGARTPVRECVADAVALARFEHRGKTCTSEAPSGRGGSTVIQYSCGGAGFGRSQLDVITPRSLRISTQGISGGQPFNYVLQARRVGDCEKTASFSRH